MKAKTIFGRYSEVANGVFTAHSLFLLRLAIGVQFLMSGFSKFGDWTAAGYLSGATGPFANWFQSMAGSGFVDALNVWGLTLIGLALIFGLFVRPASFFGAIMMLLYYFAQFEQNIAHGFIDNHIILILVFCVFLAGGIGHIYGVDGLLARHIRKPGFIHRLLIG
jgi:thiosulfate dehydrogenase (quinone) large subunit